MNDIEILEEILNRQIEDTEGTKIMKQAIENLINRVKELEHQNNILKEKNQDYKCNYNTMAEQKEKAINRVKELEEIEEEHRKENGKLQEKIKKIKENYNKLFDGYCERVSEIISLEDECESKEKSYNDCYCEYKHYKQFESIPKSKIKEKIENYNSKGYIEASGALQELLEE